MELLHYFQRLYPKTIDRPAGTMGKRQSFKERIITFTKEIQWIGYEEELADYEKRKLGIFNLLNVFQLITGILVPLGGLIFVSGMPISNWLIATLPALVSVAVLVLNKLGRYRTALVGYFIFYPIFTAVVYINEINLGVELSFVLYGILSVFFLHEIGYMVFSIALSMVSYFVLSVILQDYHYQLKSYNIVAFFINQALAILYIFYGLYLIKKENTVYESNIEMQKLGMARQAEMLQQQASELEEMNALNNKLFSIISHDLKTPMYALRNLFQHAREMKMSAKELKGLLPDVINDLNYTTGLMENLLQWSKNQLQSDTIRPQELHMNILVEDVVRLLRIQAEAKQIRIERKGDLPVYAFADMDMTNLVVRNLLSNAIKFTPVGGVITIGVQEHDTFAEIFVQDTGRGISREQMEKINENNFYTTRGTHSESGTGLGLMLCKEFLARNGGRMMIESEPGNGSTFSFTLPQIPREEEDISS